VHTLNISRVYQFELRGFHSLNHLNEETHGHLAYLRLKLALPLSDELEGEFLKLVKSKVLSVFDKKDWSLGVNGEATGENVIIAIASTLKNYPHFKIQSMELQETRKNLFKIDL
jgi:hypothetical protein